MTTMVRAASLTNFPEVARNLGLNPAQLLRRHGLAVNLFDDPERRIPVTIAVALLEESAAESRCLTFGLRMAESRQLSDFGAVSLLLSHQRTLREALTVVAEYRHLLNESLAIDVKDEGEMVVLREEIVSDVPIRSRQGIELAIGTMYRLFAALLGANWRPFSVNFTHSAPPDVQNHRRIFGGKYGSRIEFDSEFNGIVCDSEDLDRPNPLADPGMAKYARRFLESLPGASENSVLLDVRKAVYLLLPVGQATIEQVALGLGLNVRTLQRHLDEAGQSFTDILNGVRRNLAIRYIENPAYSLTRIAELLGYAMPSSFTRWFAAQHGMAPAAWRRRHGKKTLG